MLGFIANFISVLYNMANSSVKFLVTATGLVYPGLVVPGIRLSQDWLF